MSALALKFEPFRDLPPQLRGTLALGLERSDEPAGPCHLPTEPFPWPGVLHEVFAAPPDGHIGRFGPDHSFPAAAVIGFAAQQLGQGKGRLTVWIGRRVWPYPLVLERAGLLSGSLFVDATDNNLRLWAAELALRCAAVASVIADGSGFSMSATRRLQLISRESSALMLLARPSCDERQLSAAGARWRIEPVPASGEDDSPQWSIELLRCKGVRPVFVSRHGQSDSSWRLRWNAERACTCHVGTDIDHGHCQPRFYRLAAGLAGGAKVPGGLSADVGGGPDHAAAGAARRAG